MVSTNRPRIVASLILSALVAILGLLLLLPEGPFGTGLVRASYDSLHGIGRTEALTNSPVIIVYLDLASFLQERSDPGKPWPRELHAKLIRKLSAAGARRIVFDIIFGAAGADSKGDDDLASAMLQSGRVVIAAEHNLKSTHKTDENQVWTRTVIQPTPFQPFASAALAWGVASLRIDEDLMVREHLALGDDRPLSLSWATAKSLGLPVTNSIRAANRGDVWMRYYGPALTIPHVGYSEVLDSANSLDDLFRDRIAFIGARPIEGLSNQSRDEFRSPFHSWRNKEFFMPGVEVHATELLNLMRSDWLGRLSITQEAVVLIICAALFGGGLIWSRPLPSTAIAGSGAIAAYALARYTFSHGVWFPWLIISLAEIPAALGGSVLYYSVEWYRTRRRFEAKIREQAALIDKAHDAILVQNLEGKTLYANPSAARLFGWSLTEFEGDRPILELFQLDSEQVQRARAATLAKGEWNGELRLQTRAGLGIIVDSRWTLIRDKNGSPSALLLINSDITEKKELETQFLRTQRMNTIGTLAGGMAHDLNNALAPVLMGVQLLRRKSNDQESQQLLSIVEANTHRGADLVRQVLLFARGRGGDFESIELGPLIRELEKMARETFPKNIQIEVFVPADLWPVHGNVTQLHQVVMNLCVNARDAMPHGGRLSLAADNSELTAADAVSIPDAKAGRYVSLLVSDTGVGMSPEVRSRIFEAFFTTKPEGQGTGIGLATVMRIVKSHGGFLRVESEPGQGSTFELFLPCASQTTTGETAKQPRIVARGQGELILVADDEQAIRQLIAEGLISAGYQVLKAADGEEAMHLFRQRASEIRLLLTDTEMPRMSGSTLIAEARILNPRLPVIRMTGESADQVSNTEPAVLLLNKPCSLEEILSAVHHLLRQEPQEQAGKDA